MSDSKIFDLRLQIQELRDYSFNLQLVAGYSNERKALRVSEILFISKPKSYK